MFMHDGRAMEEKKGTVARLLDFAGDRAGLTYVGCALSAVAMAITMVPYVCIWLVIRSLVAVAHNLADITGTVAMFVTLLALLLVFDWRMGLACLMAAVVSIGALFTMMGGKNAGLMAQYYALRTN